MAGGFGGPSARVARVPGVTYLRIEDTFGPEEEDASLLQRRVKQKDPFHDKRWRCVANPERALVTLGPYATLEVGIIAGRNLVPRQSWMSSGLADPRVEVWRDDARVEDVETDTARRTLWPRWHYRGTVGILTPTSMVRLQVVDDQAKQPMGFVELCVGDLPYNRTIEGWLELCFQENLTRTSTERYRAHSALRFDAGPANPSDGLDGRKSSSNLVGQEELLARAAASKRNVLKGGRAFPLCTACNKDPGSPAARSPSCEDLGAPNAGELYVRLRLLRLGSALDGWLALALPRPRAKDYGPCELEPQRPAAAEAAPADLQVLWDQAWDVKLHVVDDALLCVMYWFMYVVQWRFGALSAFMLLSSAMVCWHMRHIPAVLFGQLAVALLLNGFRGLRMDMTRGGYNASLTEDGFKRVAKWMSTSEMNAYVNRVVQYDLEGEVKDPQRLRQFAAQCFRDGRPAVTLQELRRTLRNNPAAAGVAFEDPAGRLLEEGDLVLVDERRPATVMAREDTISGMVRLAYDDTAGAPQSFQAQKRPGLVATVPVGRTQRRANLGSMKVWLVGRVLGNAIRSAHPSLQAVRRALPLLEALTDVVTWRSRCTAFAIWLVLCSVSAVFAYASVAEQIDDLGLTKHWYASKSLIVVGRVFDNLVYGGILVAILILNARWFASCASLGRIFWRCCALRRQAPKRWAFFREDEVMRAELGLGLR